MYHEQEREDVPKADSEVSMQEVLHAGENEAVEPVARAGSGRGIRAVKMGVFGAVFALVGFCAGLGVNLRQLVKDYIEEADGDWRVVTLLQIMGDIDQQCRESNERTKLILQKLEEIEK